MDRWVVRKYDAYYFVNRIVVLLSNITQVYAFIGSNGSLISQSIVHAVNM